MKKVLLLICCALCAFTASAQQPERQKSMLDSVF